VDFKKGTPWHLSELASALATMELASGSTRRARKLFHLALKQPTENTIAQARWAASLDSGIRLEQKHYDDPRSAEARAWRFYYEGKWEAALRNFWTWHFDQPFSSNPCATGSFVASEILGNYDDAADFATSGLTANPDHPTLLNNLAFALIHNGKPAAATAALARIRGQIQVEHWIPVLATQGLFHFRYGDLDRGRELYRLAIEKAKRVRPDLAVLAKLHLALEERLVGTPESEERIKEALVEAELLNLAYLKAILQRLRVVFRQTTIEFPTEAQGTHR
jgi:tetratricopeptide (TPR) repeat protein